MGITGLWDILGDGDVVELAKLSTEHFLKHGRPFRIAIDEAGWRFHNLTAQQVFAIKQREPAANPIEKAILYRVIKLLRLNIQPLFVFDGPRRPWKRGKKGGGRVDYDRTKLLTQLLDALRVPHHRAPAEAEAECARLQKEGVVDAVWSDDGDTLMFGATMLVKEVREDGGGTKKSGKKSDSLVRVYKATTIQQSLRLDKAGLLLFVLLAGGDYDVQGLLGCGQKTSFKAVQWQDGRLSNILMSAASAEGASRRTKLDEFRGCLRDFLFQEHVSIQVPADFPKDLALKNYHQPVVSSSEQLHDLRGLRQGWDRTFDEPKLLPLLQSKFNFWSKEYTKHIIPILLTQRLRRIALGDTDDEFVRNVQLTPKRTKADLDKPIIFLPASVTTLDLTGEMRDGSPFDTTEPAETNMLRCLLEPVLGEAALNTASVAKAPKKTTVNQKQDRSISQVQDAANDPQMNDNQTLKPATVKRPRGASSTTKTQYLDNEIPLKPAKKSRKTITTTSSQDKENEPISDIPSLGQAKTVSGPPPSFRLPRLNDQLARLLPPAQSQPQSTPPARITAVVDLSNEDKEPFPPLVPTSSSDIRDARLRHFEMTKPVSTGTSTASDLTAPLPTKVRAQAVIDLTDD